MKGSDQIRCSRNNNVSTSGNSCGLAVLCNVAAGHPDSFCVPLEVCVCLYIFVYLCLLKWSPHYSSGTNFPLEAVATDRTLVEGVEYLQEKVLNQSRELSRLHGEVEQMAAANSKQWKRMTALLGDFYTGILYRKNRIPRTRNVPSYSAEEKSCEQCRVYHQMFTADFEMLLEFSRNTLARGALLEDRIRIDRPLSSTLQPKGKHSE